MRPAIVLVGIGALAAIAFALGSDAGGEPRAAGAFPLQHFTRADVVGAGGSVGVMTAGDLAAADLTLAGFVIVVGADGRSMRLTKLARNPMLAPGNLTSLPPGATAPAYVGFLNDGTLVPFDPSNVRAISKD